MRLDFATVGDGLVNYDTTCAEFYKCVKGHKELLETATFSKKFGHPSNCAID